MFIYTARGMEYEVAYTIYKKNMVYKCILGRTNVIYCIRTMRYGRKIGDELDIAMRFSIAK